MKYFTHYIQTNYKYCYHYGCVKKVRSGKDNSNYPGGGAIIKQTYRQVGRGLYIEPPQSKICLEN